MGIDSGIPAIVVKKKNEVRKYDIYIYILAVQQRGSSYCYNKLILAH